MTLLAPLHLLLLLALPVLWWLSLPRRPRQQTWTPHLAQWQAALAALRRRPPRLARLRFVLLALAAAAVALAFAAPLHPGTPGPRRLVVLLDASSSMASGGAWQRARQALAAAFAALPTSIDVTLLRAGGSLLRRHGASARALHDLGEPGGALDVDLRALAAQTNVLPDTAVWTLTDGQGQDALPAPGALTVCGNRGPNAAVLAVRVEDRWPLPELALDVDFVACTEAPSRVELRASGALAGEAAVRTVECVPGVARSEHFDLTRAAAGGELRVAVALPGDVLATDDAWTALLPRLPTPRIGVLVDGDGGPFAEKAAQALADEVGGTVVPAGAGSEVGLLLVDGGRTELAPGRVRALTFGAALAGAGEPALWRLPVVADWNRADPLTTGLDLSELQIERAWRGVLPAGEPFLWADEAGAREPLAVVAGQGDVASVHFAFRLQDSNLPLLAAFPQLLRRAFVRSYGAGAAPRVTSAVPGAGEQDLLRAATAPDRALPAFGTEDRDLASWFLLGGLCALALRAFVR
jgi:hypothetical protein